MARSKAVPDHIRKKNEEELYRFYYEHEDVLRIEQYDKYTFRIWHGENMVDVWPARKRYYNGKMNESRTYHRPEDLKITLGMK